MKIDDLIAGSKYTNDDICKAFLCSPRGGMRRSKRTNTLVLISNQKSIYDGRWLENKLYYIGMGSQGSQTLKGNQNITLYESNTNGIEVHLFEMFTNKVNTYMGRVQLADKPFQEKQDDADGQLRQVWVFPLQLIDEGKPVRMDELERVFQDEFRESQQLTIKQLKDRINKIAKHPGSRESTTRVYKQSPYVIDFTLRRASGACELCNQKAPFNKPNGEPYLEVHHIHQLADGGEDTTENAVALCPNCHRMMHSLNRKSDIDMLILANKARKT
jgi:5-methylcytosine-specific restriction protein A